MVTSYTFFLKVQQRHTSGEWFKISSNEAKKSVKRVIKELSSSGQLSVEDERLTLGGGLRDADVALSQLLNTEWRVSKKGNDWFKVGENHLVVFSIGPKWKYSCNGDFSDDSFSSKIEAKAAALQHILPQV